MLLTNRVLAFLLLFSVSINVGLFQSFLNRPRAGEKTLQVSHDGKQLTLTIGDGQSYPVSVVMSSEQARALARSVNKQADEIDGELPVPPVTLTVEEAQQQDEATEREAAIQEQMRKGSTANPFENY